jgi:peptide/nickel transport system permease protein
MSLHLSRRPPSRRIEHFKSNKPAVIALVLLVALILIGAAAPLLAPQDPFRQDLGARLLGPSGDHLLGTDELGRDTLSRLIYATRVTFLAVAQGLAVGVILGIPLGLIAGYVRGAFDAIANRVSDALLALPPLVLALATVGILGPGLTNAMIAVGLIIAPRLYRVARAATLSASAEAYVEAAVADGLQPWRILIRHIIPNASGPMLVQVSFGVGVVIAAEASLSFLGLGVQAPQASWGSMIREGYSVVAVAPVPILWPTLLVTLATVAIFTVGDAWRDALQGAGEKK